MLRWIARIDSWARLCILNMMLLHLQVLKAWLQVATVSVAQKVSIRLKPNSQNTQDDTNVLLSLCAGAAVQTFF